MEASIEISLYPLSENYKDVIVEFLKSLKSKNANLRIETNGLSTQIFGEYDALMKLLQGEMKKVLEENKAVFILKLSSGMRTPESVEGLLG
ncbi:MAG: YkoF family thiamine/hydroxymethylpyrimidine-binding protein [Chitinophagales bacterium]